MSKASSDPFWDQIRSEIRQAALLLSPQERAERAASGVCRVVARDVRLVVVWGGKTLCTVDVPIMSGTVPPPPSKGST